MAKKLWGGRFKKNIDPEFYEFQKSIHYDHKLAKYDIYHSLIHVEALVDAEIITAIEGRKLLTALRSILTDIEKKRFVYNPDCEDIHSAIQDKVAEKVGPLSAKLHTMRSRNDQVVFDEKMYCLDQYINIVTLLHGLLEVLCEKANDFKESYFVGYTHTQRAQIISFSDYLLAYVEMFMRDSDRLTNFEESMELFIGSGALAGSSISPRHYKNAISISGVVKKHFQELRSSLDNVSNRDFVIEMLSILSLVQVHLSRMAEDFILYSTKEFDYVDLPEEFCTGSSLMPHKKNADFLELVRGYSGRIFGNLMAVLTTMKGLPLTYNRDMQLDKEPLFSSVEIVSDEIKIMTKFIKGIKLKNENIAKALEDESIYATEIAEYLVTKRKVPFSDAHETVGKLIRYSEDNNIKIRNMSLKVLAGFNKYLTPVVLTKIMTPSYVVSTKKTASKKIPKLKERDS